MTCRKLAFVRCLANDVRRFIALVVLVVAVDVAVAVGGRIVVARRAGAPCTAPHDGGGLEGASQPDEHNAHSGHSEQRDQCGHIEHSAA